MSGFLDWDEIYRSGRHRDFWDLAYPSPEIAAYVATRADAAGKTALDLGCGSGKDAVLLAQAGYQAFGVDISREAIRIAEEHSRRENVEVHWHCGSALHLPFEPASFDLITDRGCFHHLTDPEREAYAREIARALKPNGELLLRGCSVERFPFVPITEAALQRAFSGGTFMLGKVVPIRLITDAGPLPGNICLIHKRRAGPETQ